MSLLSSIAPHLAASARERVRQIPVRIALAGLVSLSLHAAGRQDVILPWLALVGLVQGYEYLIMAPYRRPGRMVRGDTGTVIPALLAVVAMSTAYSGMAVVLWSTGLTVLITTSVLILCGGLMNNVASAVESRPLFVIGAVPYLGGLGVMAVASIWGGDGRHWPLLTLGALLFVAGMMGVWKRTHQARAAEVEARADAEARLAQAEAAMADRAAMAAIVSHELRTPVSAILASAQIIRDGKTANGPAEAADLILDAGRLMAGMLNDLLDHSKIEARGMTLETRDFDLQAFVADAVRFWSAPAAEKGLVLAAEGPDAPVWLKGDPHRLRQIVNNLMSNAIKFTPRGRVTLAADVRPDPLGARLVLTVRDQGQGIAPEAMTRLFSPFAQGSAEVARTYGGTGLGLTVSRDLARLMGGDLTARNPADGGAAFILEAPLPLGRPADAGRDADAVCAAPAPGRRLRILAVDDHEVNRRTLALVLQPLEVNLCAASDGHEALERLAEAPFDVVLMDVNMPGLDGNETTRRLRAAEGPNRDVPVIGFSAGVEPAQVAACRAAGMTDWLPKPLEPQRLYAALERALASPKPDARDDGTVAA